MKRKTFYWMVMVCTLILVAGLGMACGNANSGPGDSDHLTPGEPPIDEPVSLDDTAKVTVTWNFSPETTERLRNLEENGCSGEICGQLLTPGVPPGTIELYGTLIGINELSDRGCYSPWDPTCVVDYSGDVSGGELSTTFDSPIGTLVHMAYILEGKMRADSITVSVGADSYTFTQSCILGDPNSYYTWFVISFMIQRDQDGVETIVPNPACVAEMYRVQLQVNGDSNTDAFDDTILPYDGSTEGPMLMVSSLYNDGSGTQQTMATFNAGLQAWTEDLYMAATDTSASIPMSAAVSIYRSSREPTAPPGASEPELGGVRLVTYNVGGGSPLCTTELEHWEDIDTAAGFFYAGLIERLDPTSHCVVQQADNRAAIIGGP